MKENKNIVFSGFFNDILSNISLSKGYSISNVTNQNTFCVLIDDPYKYKY